MKSDIEIARSIELKKIKVIADSIGIPREEVENYGRYIAKIPETLIDEEKVKQSNLILVTAITALAKGHGALSLGNIIGANIFNLVLVSGVAVTISPFAVPEGSKLFGQNTSLVMELPLMVGVMALMTLPALFKKKLFRWQGAALLAIYVAFVTLQVLIALHVI